MMEIAQIGIVIKHIGDFEEESRISSNIKQHMFETLPMGIRIQDWFTMGFWFRKCRANVCQFESSGN